MKILHVTQGYYPSLGGTEWLIQRLSEEMHEQFGDEVNVFATNCYNGEGFFNPKAPRYPAGSQEINGITVRRFPVRSLVSAFLWKLQQPAYANQWPYNQYIRSWAQGPLVPGLEKSIIESNADVIAASSFPLMHMYVAQRAARKMKKPCVFIGALHPEDHWGFGRQMIYQSIRECTEYIANTDYEAEFVIRMGANPHQVHVGGVGVDPEPYKTITTEGAKKRYGFGSSPVVGFVGQVAAHKLDMLIAAMPSVWKVIPDAHLLIAGAKTSYDATLQKTFASWPEEFRAKTRLIYNFEETEKPFLFSAVDVFAYPSAWESFGIAYVEAWAACKPPVGCFRGAVPWVIEGGKDGLLVKFQDNEMLAQAIILLLKNPSWARAMGEAGHKKMLEKYTWQKIGRKVRDVYEMAVERNRMKLAG